MNENKNHLPEEEILSIFDIPEEEEITQEPEAPEVEEPIQEPVFAEEAQEPVFAEEPQESDFAEEAQAPIWEEEVPVPEEEVPFMEEAEPALLEDPTAGIDIDADETAVIGLARHGDAELEQIIRETSMEKTQVIRLPHQQETPKPKRKKKEKTAPQPVPEEEEEEEPVRKRRPKMKKGYGLLGIPHILVTAVWLAIILLIGVTLGRMGWIAVSEILAFNKPDQSIVITLSDGDNIDTITAKLKAAGLIEYPELFKKYAELTKAEEDIAPGTFTLNTKYDYFALVKAMSYHSPARETVKLAIPEGYTCAQIFALLEENGVCSVEKLEEYAANGEIKDRWFLEGLERGHKYCLEGYLFPDTYEFYTNDDPARVLGKFLDGFNSRFTDIMKARIDTLNERMAEVLRNRGYEESVIEERKFTIRDIIIIASMIEKETSNDAESYDISSVIYNRLTNPANYPYLNIDATLIYALDGNIDPETGKTKPLTNEDLQMDHPYNTYVYKGLIPGPISNPGQNSLNAALDPNETSYYFYVYNPKTYVHLFGKTAAEHEKNVNTVRSQGG